MVSGARRSSPNSVVARSLISLTTYHSLLTKYQVGLCRMAPGPVTWGGWLDSLLRFAALDFPNPQDFTMIPDHHVMYSRRNRFVSFIAHCCLAVVLLLTMAHPAFAAAEDEKPNFFIQVLSNLFDSKELMK